MSKENTLMQGEINTRVHIKDVNDLMLDCAKELIDRAKNHDLSKLKHPEHELFSIAAAKFSEKGNEYGTKGYEETKKSLGKALEHHYKHNSHHPEHYNNGIKGMNLFDLLEMLMDWKAASMRRSSDGVLDLSISRTQHKVSDELMQILINTADFLGFDYKV